MKKTSVIFYVVVILLSAGAAIASSKAHQSADPVLYYKYGNNYYYAGIYGVDYDCERNPVSICTYYYEPTSKQYLPYSSGRYVSIQLKNKK